MAKGEVKITGGRELAAKLRGLGDNGRAGHAAGAALYQEGEQIMARSKEEFVPVDLGNLRDTGHVELPEIEGTRVSVTLGFGGPAADYALEQHEDLSLHHEVGGAKYLEKPLMEAADGMTDRLGARMRRELGI